MNSRNMLLITCALLLTISYFSWQSYRQLGQAQTRIQALESQLDSLRVSVAKYHQLQLAYTEIHSALRASHDQLSQISNDLNSRSLSRRSDLMNIKLQLDSIRLAYDTLLTSKDFRSLDFHEDFRIFETRTAVFGSLDDNHDLYFKP